MGRSFVYAVRSTGVFCRAGCGSRLPRRDRVEFFPTPDRARAAGFRACRRCRPDAEPGTDPATSSVRRACRLIEEVEGELDARAIAGELGWSERHLRRMFSDVLGVQIGAYAQAVKAERARGLLRDGAPVSTAIYDAGYGSSRAFYANAAPRLGMTPARYRSGGAGEQIRYALSRIGTEVLLVASSDRGVCSVKIGAEGTVLEELAAEFPRAARVQDEEGLAAIVAVLLGALEHGSGVVGLPLDIEATAFQARVWRCLGEIPRGTTQSYAQVARSIGAPKAHRAVASACAANPVVLAIPCHRVVRSDGSLGGYRYGTARKAELLRREAESASQGE